VSRRCILVLGMHRSGTSAVTRALGLLSGELPAETMPPAADNPRGYWESPPLARFNNQLLRSAGTAWNDEAAIPEAWFADPARAADRARAVDLLAAAFPGDSTFIFKDPRICRLLPFWRTTMETAGIEFFPVLMLRDPVEVARSLAARADDPAFRPAAVVAEARGVLLWLRYVLDAERHSRDTPRHVIGYSDLLADWRRQLEPLLEAGLLPPLRGEAAEQVDAFLDHSLRRNRSGDNESAPDDAFRPGRATARGLLTSLHDQTLSPSAADALAACLDQLVAAYAPLRGQRSPQEPHDPWAEAILSFLDRLPAAAPAAPRPHQKPSVEAAPRAVFLSGVPNSIGHIYRVEHPVAALQTAGWRATWLPLDDPRAGVEAAAADLVVVFRGGWSDQLARIAETCRQRGAALIYDVDDLLFDPAVIAAGQIAVLAVMAPEERQRWITSAASHRTLLERADAAVLTTRPLAEAASRHCRRCFVLPNSLDHRMEAAAAAALPTPKDSASDGQPRICFASGTPSHDRDFAVAAEAIARLFARTPEPRLVVIGHLDARIYPCLLPFTDRIEWRPPVPLLEIFGHLARCDINLAPLELGNPFCDGKSAVRCLFAAAVGVPTVASPTQPLREAIVDGETGLLAADVAAWEDALGRLTADAGLRERLGQAARLHALAQSGFAAYRDLAAETFTRIVHEARDRRQVKPGEPAA